MKYYITGCAKSGTTLLRRLFNSFDIDNIYNYDEVDLPNFIKSPYNVGKRTSNTIFSNILTQREIETQLKLIKDNNIQIINIVREKDDVLKSDNGYVTKQRYDHSIDQMMKYHNHISKIIIYEDLIQNPDEIQKQLQNQFSLKIKNKFSEYPDFIDVTQEKYHKHIYSLRPIGKKIDPA